jgi:WD40 repeat protein
MVKLRFFNLIVLVGLLSLSTVMQAQDSSLTAYGVAWSPDGKWLGISSNQGAWFYEAEDLGAEPLHYLPDIRVTVIAFDTTGTYAAMPGAPDSSDDIVSVIDIHTGDVFRSFEAPESAGDGFSVFYDMRFSSDNQYLIVGNTSILYIFDVEAGEEVASYDFADPDNSRNIVWVTSVADTKEPNAYVTTNWGSTLNVFDAETHTTRQFSLSDDLYLYAAAYLRDTTYLLRADEGVFRFDIDTETLT